MSRLLRRIAPSGLLLRNRSLLLSAVAASKPNDVPRVSGSVTEIIPPVLKSSSLKAAAATKKRTSAKNINTKSKEHDEKVPPNDSLPVLTTFGEMSIVEAEIVLQKIFKTKSPTTIGEWIPVVTKHMKKWTSSSSLLDNSMSVHRVLYTHLNEVNKDTFSHIIFPSESKLFGTGFNVFLVEFWSALPKPVKEGFACEESITNDLTVIEETKELIDKWNKKNPEESLDENLISDFNFWLSEDCDGRRKEIAVSELKSDSFIHSNLTLFAKPEELFFEPTKVIQTFLDLSVKERSLLHNKPLKKDKGRPSITRLAVFPFWHFCFEKSNDSWKKYKIKLDMTTVNQAREKWSLLDERDKLPYYVKARGCLRLQKSLKFNNLPQINGQTLFASETGLENREYVTLSDHRRSYYNRQASKLQERYLDVETFSGGITGFGVYARGAGNSYLTEGEVNDNFQFLSHSVKDEPYHIEACENLKWVERGRYSWNSPYGINTYRIMQRARELYSSMTANKLMVLETGKKLPWSAVDDLSKQEYESRISLKNEKWIEMTGLEMEDQFDDVTPLSDRLANIQDDQQRFHQVDYYIRDIIHVVLNCAEEKEKLPLGIQQLVASEFHHNDDDALDTFVDLPKNLLLYYKEQLSTSIELIKDVYNEDPTPIAAANILKTVKTLVEQEGTAEVYELQRKGNRYREVRSKIIVLMGLAVEWQQEEMYYALLDNLLKYSENRFNLDPICPSSDIENELVDRVRNKSGFKLPLYRPLTNPELCPPLYHHANRRSLLTVYDIFTEYTGKPAEKYPMLSSSEKSRYDLPFATFNPVVTYSAVESHFGKEYYFYTVCPLSTGVEDSESEAAKRPGRKIVSKADLAKFMGIEDFSSL